MVVSTATGQPSSGCDYRACAHTHPQTQINDKAETDRQNPAWLHEPKIPLSQCEVVHSQIVRRPTMKHRYKHREKKEQSLCSCAKQTKAP